MKKIPTLFKRVFEGHRIIGIKDEITPGCEEAFLHGIPTVKYDGACCAVIDGILYKRYDAKKGKTPPKGAIPCCDPDPITGHWPHWVKVDPHNPADKWFMSAFDNYSEDCFHEPYDGTYEAVGPQFNGNPHKYPYNTLIAHGRKVIGVDFKSFEDVRYYLEHHEIEGIVFWFNEEPVCKIKRSDFGFTWPVKKEEE